MGYIELRKLCAPFIKKGASVVVARAGAGKLNCGCYVSMVYDKGKIGKEFTVTGLNGRRGTNLSDGEWYPFYCLEPSIPNRNSLLRNILYDRIPTAIYGSYTKPFLLACYEIIQSMAALAGPETKEGREKMAKRISFKSIFEYFGSEERAFEIVDKATEVIRSEYIGKDANDELSAKAKQIKQLCMAFGSVGAIGERLSEILSLVIEENISFKNKASELPFSFLSCIKINGNKNLWFMIYHCENKNMKLLSSDGTTVTEQKMQKGQFVPATSEEIRKYINSVF